MIIDAHHHFWQVQRGDYGWLTPELTALYRDFEPGDLIPALAQHRIGGTVLVQAAPTIAETEFMLRLADDNPFILGVVGWVDFESSSVTSDIARLATHDKLVGLRPMIQDIADDDWMLDAKLEPAFEATIDHDLTFDALVLPRHLGQLHQLLHRYPKMRCVIDHGAKPEIAAGRFDKWADGIAKIALESTAYCKLSGLVTEAGAEWTSDQIAPYAAHLLAQFGTDRLIWGSDWPVLTLVSDYDAWFALARTLVPGDDAQDAVFGKNAQTFYRLALAK